MPTTLERGRSAARAAVMGGYTLGMLAGVTLAQRASAPEERQPVFQEWMKQWAGGLLHVFGMQTSLATPLPPPATGARLIVSNHRSPIDILLLLQHFGGVVLSRGDLARWPLLGLAARRAETIFVDRGDAMSGMRAVRAMRERLAAGRTVIVFPEGTTHRGDDVRPFQEGAFAAATSLKLPVEIVPVGIAYSEGAEFVDETFVEHMSRVAARRATHVSCAVGAPRLLSGRRAELAGGLRDEVQSLVSLARRNLGP
jgi:1-acyl-sn-glycerol-3-phosphate acyltransferase